jgi:hypothetical protein
LAPSPSPLLLGDRARRGWIKFAFAGASKNGPGLESSRAANAQSRTFLWANRNLESRHPFITMMPTRHASCKDQKFCIIGVSRPPRVSVRFTKVRSPRMLSIRQRFEPTTKPVIELKDRLSGSGRSAVPVYSASYKPSRDSYSGGKILAGEAAIRLADESLDGGVGISMNNQISGRAVVPSSVPTAIYWASKRKPQDFENLFVRTVSQRFRLLIEAVEPRVHQFIPLQYVKKSRELLEKRWFWQICNRVDSIFTDRPGWVLDRGLWRYPADDQLIFDIQKISQFHFWHEKHILSGILMSEHAMARLNEENISGFRMTEHATV